MAEEDQQPEPVPSPVETTAVDPVAGPAPSGAPPSGGPPASASGAGCLRGGLLAFFDIWILASVLIAHIFTWLAEQELATGLNPDNPRWLITLLLGLLILVPAGLAWWLAKSSPSRRFYAAYAQAGLFVVLLAPARLPGLTQAYTAALLLILGMGIFLALTSIRLGAAQPVRAGFAGLAFALLLAGLVGLPWLAWGAFGSLADTLLNLAVALLFGLCAARLLAGIYASVPEAAEAATGPLDSAPGTAAAPLVKSTLTGFVLLVMAAGIGVNGSQVLLAFMIPSLAWLLPTLYQRHRLDEQPLVDVDDFEDDRPRVRASISWLDNRWTLALLIGLSAFWPLALLDPDELAAAAGFGLFELLSWTAQAVIFSIIVALAAAAILALFRRGYHPARSSIVVSLAALAVWLLAAALYFSMGQPGLHGDRLFVILKQQVDLSLLAQIDDYKQRRTAVYTLLVQQSDLGQAGLRHSLDRLGIAYRPFYLENALEVEGGPLVRLWLESRPEVDRVLESPVLRPLAAPPPTASGFSDAPEDPPWNLTMIGADRVWRELGVTGAGIIIGQSDSGVQGDHPELADGFRGRLVGPDYSWYDPWNNSHEPVDIGGHGTHTLGTVLGNRVGVAPDAQWIGCVNLARNLGSPSYYLDCLQFLFAPFPQGGDPLHDGVPDLGAHVLNNSWGCPPLEGCDPKALLPAVTALRAAGVFVAVSAGNDGSYGCGSVADPIAVYDQVYSVGAVDSSGNLASFSSLGPVTVDGSQRVKPDITAPGVSVLSSFPGSTYASTSGTSMAGPHLAGVVALMWSANPTLIGDIDRTEQILNETASPYAGLLPECVTSAKPNNAVGYGILDAYEAVSEALGR